MPTFPCHDYYMSSICNLVFLLLGVQKICSHLFTCLFIETNNPFAMFLLLVCRYLYITQLRDPIARYLSEWRHVQRGATWPSKNMCDGRLPTSQEVPLCYKGENWVGVTLDQFLDCKWNMANNRQTRMLADLSLVGCYNLTKMSLEDRNWLMLESARRNLRRLAYFGLTEYQVESQYLFEEIFDMKFHTPFEQLEETHASRSTATPKQLERIAKLNALDVELYEYAKALFLQRLNYLSRKSSDSN